MNNIAEIFFLIFSSAAAMATLALVTRQPLIFAFILVGVILGPHGTNVISNIDLLKQISSIGIVFLLFLLGLDMQPGALVATLKKSLVIVFVSSALFFALGYIITRAFGFNASDALIAGTCMMFSSTIIGIKLLPTTSLHHKHIGELLIGILLLQDVIAIIVLSLLLSTDSQSGTLLAVLGVLALIPCVALLCFGFVRFVILPLIKRFDHIQEYLFLLSVGWCLGAAEVAELLGLSREIGAFFAGVSLASSPISQYIAMSLKPLRDFFLVIFFFALGASLQLDLLGDIWLISLLLAVAYLVFKPLVFRFLIRKQSESRRLSWDLGLRLGQISEFSLMIVFVAMSAGVLNEKAATVIQFAAILSFVISSYIVVYTLPNPIAPSARLRRD